MRGMMNFRMMKTIAKEGKEKYKAVFKLAKPLK